MKKIKGPWTYRTPTVTIDYPAGEFQVSDEIAAAFKEETDGNGAAKAAATGDPIDLEG